MISKLGIRFLVLILLTVADVAQAAGGADKPDVDEKRSQFLCTEIMAGTEKGEIIVRHDGLSKEYAEQAQKDAESARDTLHKLGVPTPPHQIIMAPEQQLNILAATGVVPMPHAISGAKLYDSMRTGKSLGILEFAQPGGAKGGHLGSGCSTCRSYYSNTTKLSSQRPIYFHVGGHNHVFMRSLISRMRNTDPIASSVILAEKMENMYKQHGHEPVSLYFHYLDVAMQLQDFQGGSFVHPDMLSPQKSGAVEVDVKQAEGNWSFLNTGKTQKIFPWQKTPSVLQFQVSNLPMQIAPFKRELLQAYEAVTRVYPAVLQQQFVHEGWSTFLMLLGQKHSEWNSPKDVFEFARVVSMAAGGPLNIQQPYSMGLNCYHHLYMRFMRDPKLKGLTALAADALFVKYIDSLLPTLTDSRLLELVIDNEFVSRHNLTLAQHGTSQEMTPHVEAAKAAGVPEDKIPNGLLISKSADRIRAKIIREVGTKDLAGFLAINPAMANPYQLTLEQRDSGGKPLEPFSAAQVLFAQTQVTELPVSATMILSDRFFVPAAPPDHDPLQTGFDFEKPAPPKAHGTFFARMEVRPDGRVRLFKRQSLDALKQEKEEEIPAFGVQLSQAVDYFRTDQSFSFSDKVVEEDERRWENMFPKMISDAVAAANLEPLTGLVDYAPTAARAILEFSKLVKARFARQMEAAMQGKLRLKFGPNGVKLPLIPMSPNLHYDSEHKPSQQRQPSPIDTIERRAQPSFATLTAFQDDDAVIGSTGGSVGNPVRLPPQNGGGGSGEGAKDGEAREIEVPSELYRKILRMHFNIPNARETNGETPMMKDIRMGLRKDATEEPLWEEMVGDALAKAIVARKIKGQQNPLGQATPMQLIREGFAKLDEDDYIIRSKREVPIPSFDAVVMVFVDLSGSVQGHRLKRIRNMTYNIRELFRSVYPNVKFEFIGHSDKAKRYTEQQIWNASMGGGTNHGPPFELGQEVLDKEYPTSRWNRYLVIAGDGETMNLDTMMQGFEKLQPSLQHVSLIVARESGSEPDADPDGIRAALTAYKAKWPWISMTQIEEDEQIFRALGDLYGKKKP